MNGNHGKPFSVCRTQLQHNLDFLCVFPGSKCEVISITSQIFARLRQTREVTKLADSGVPAQRRFAFYDQVGQSSSIWCIVYL